MLDHFRNPRHAQWPEGDDTRNGHAGSRRQGTYVEFAVTVADGVIAGVGYRVFGSPFAIAACSLMAERMLGQAAQADAVVAGRELASALSFPTDRTGIALLVEDAVRAALYPPRH